MPDAKTPRWRFLPRHNFGMSRDGHGFGRSGDINGNGKSDPYAGTVYLPWNFAEDLSEAVILPDLYRDPDA